MLLLIIKGLLAGLVVISITLLAEKSSKAAGLLIWIPIVSILSYISIGLSSASHKLPQVAAASIPALLVLLVYSLIIWQALERLPWPLALVVGVISWAVAAAVYLKLIS